MKGWTIIGAVAGLLFLTAVTAAAQVAKSNEKSPVTSSAMIPVNQRQKTTSRPFEGVYQTTYGRMRLWQEGAMVTGVYEFAGRSTMKGTITGGKANLKYEQPDGEQGTVIFTLSADGTSLTGEWKGDDGNGGRWEATRMKALSGVTFLVVLEAPWETSLVEPEYSFGQMLRSYFARVPSVQVRQRALYSERDLHRWCGELVYIAEPVVLYLSSHGTEKGLSLPGGTVEAKAIAKALRDCGHLKLLHFGSCLIGSGQVPRQIFAELGTLAHFPISGYKFAADWGGSAVTDFTFLELVLARGMEPLKAVEQTRKMLTFARDEGNPEDALPVNGLVVFSQSK